MTTIDPEDDDDLDITPQARLIAALADAGFSDEHFRCLARSVRQSRYGLTHIILRAARPDIAQDISATFSAVKDQEQRIERADPNWVSTLDNRILLEVVYTDDPVAPVEIP